MSGFDGYELEQIAVGDQSLRVRRGGSGPPLLLLHGYPETHLCWAGVAEELQQTSFSHRPTLVSGQPLRNLPFSCRSVPRPAAR